MQTLAVIAEATRRSGLVWVDGQAVWHLWHDDAAYVVCGGEEQPLEVRAVALVEVRSRARQRDLLVRWVADVNAVEPGTPEWDVVAPLLVARRQSARDRPTLATRWAAGSRVLRLTPTGEQLAVDAEERVVAPHRHHPGEGVRAREADPA